MIRRRFLGAFGAAAAWPALVQGQQGERVRLLGVLSPSAPDDPASVARMAVVERELALVGWIVGRNLKIEFRSTEGDAEKIRRHVAEMVALAPDVVLAIGSSNVVPLSRATRTVPIVFPIGVDPVGAGYVASLARPGANVTGFLSLEYSLSAKWLELLKQIAPGTNRVAVLRDGTVAIGAGQYDTIRQAATALGVETIPVDMRDSAEIERSIAAFANAPHGGMIATQGGPLLRERALLIALAARHRLPAVFPQRDYVAQGGLVSYGSNALDNFRRAAGYIDRILKGAKPADLPVQAPTKYELVVNLKTAKALGIDLPATLIATADEVIE